MSVSSSTNQSIKNPIILKIGQIIIFIYILLWLMKLKMTNLIYTWFWTCDFIYCVIQFKTHLKPSTSIKLIRIPYIKKINLSHDSDKGKMKVIKKRLHLIESKSAGIQNVFPNSLIFVGFGQILPGHENNLPLYHLNSLWIFQIFKSVD